MIATVKPLFTPSRLSARVAELGKQISKAHGTKPLDVVAIMDNAIVFAADLMRHLRCPAVCHCVRAEIRDVELGGYTRKEILFSPEPYLKGRDVLLVDAVLHTGVTLEFWARRLQASKPRSLRIAVLVNKPLERKVDLKPDYFCFESASKQMVGYGLPGPNGQYRNLPYVGTLDGKVQSGRRAKASGSRHRKARG